MDAAATSPRLPAWPLHTAHPAHLSGTKPLLAGTWCAWATTGTRICTRPPPPPTASAACSRKPAMPACAAPGVHLVGCLLAFQNSSRVFCPDLRKAGACAARGARQVGCLLVCSLPPDGGPCLGMRAHGGLWCCALSSTVLTRWSCPCSSPAGSMFASASQDGSVAVWDQRSSSAITHFLTPLVSACCCGALYWFDSGCCS